MSIESPVFNSHAKVTDETKLLKSEPVRTFSGKLAPWSIELWGQQQ
jgi:hypothetical protein